jgi:hypothetical protein
MMHCRKSVHVTCFGSAIEQKFTSLVIFIRCKSTSFVDSIVYQEAKVLFCPSPGCSCVRYKACQMPLPLSNGGANADEPQHSCDGSSERV